MGFYTVELLTDESLIGVTLLWPMPVALLLNSRLAVTFDDVYAILRCRRVEKCPIWTECSSTADVCYHMDNWCILCGRPQGMEITSSTAASYAGGRVKHSRGSHYKIQNAD